MQCFHPIVQEKPLPTHREELIDFLQTAFKYATREELGDVVDTGLFRFGLCGRCNEPVVMYMKGIW